MIKLFTDGACAPNPGCGGWGCVIVYPSGQTAQHCGYISDNTTNNYSELYAIYEGIRRVDPRVKTIIYTDSQYVVNSINNGWAKNWHKRNWKTANGNPIAHKDLWVKILAMIDKRNLSFEWIKGHSGNIYNEMADKLATIAIISEKMRREKDELMKMVPR